MKTFQNILGWLVTILTPVMLVLTAVRLLLTPLYIQVEYRLPYFPEDRYGFSQSDRIYWADLARLYLLNNAGIDFLAQLQFPEGQQAAGDCDEFQPPRDCSYFYNDRELRHMLDVKVIVKATLAVLGLALFLTLGLGFWAYWGGWWPGYRRSLERGGWAAVGLIMAILAYLALNFNSLFINFHRIFFEGDTWLFHFSDSLIRLFPTVFWRDAFIWAGGLTLLGAAGLIYWARQPVELSRLILLRTRSHKSHPKSKIAKNKRRR
ncbi:MAG: TIGR01906 family membrane protein [Anaerolineales bacterium]|nr:TIGR01906 family membrane protein [Anaerolineales bacterium]